MKLLLILTIPANLLGQQIDRVCPQECATLAVERGIVTLHDPAGRRLDLGSFASSARPLVPQNEAPIRDFRSNNGWRVIVTAFLDHAEDDPGNESLRIRFFDPSHNLRKTEDGLALLAKADMGSLFGGTDVIFSLTTWEEHAYNTESELWYLPDTGPPKSLNRFTGAIGKFFQRSRASPSGVNIEFETYDGEHAATKGRVSEFWAWDPKTKSLLPPANKPKNRRAPNG